MRSSRDLAQAGSGASPSAHTPGPWQIADDYTRDGNFKIIGNVDGEYFTDSAAPVMTYEFVASLVDEYDETHAATKANRRLILAAPDLLDAAQRVMATKKAWDDYARIGMPSRALLQPPDREAGNKAFADLASAIAKALGPSAHDTSDGRVSPGMDPK